MSPRFEMHEDWAHLTAWAGVVSSLATVTSIKSMASFKSSSARSRFHPVIRISPRTGHREIVWMREGLIPSYACDDRGAEHRSEAHAEAMTCDSCFRSAFLRRRCLIPASVLNEQRHLGTDIEQQCSFALESGELFAIAGVWETWTNDQGHAIQSFAVVTTLVTPVLRTLFDRMPVILTDSTDQERWLRASKEHEQPPVDLMHPLTSAQLRHWKMVPGPVDMQLDMSPHATNIHSSSPRTSSPSEP
ncbi:SOS response-associated peptidase family protein [Terriglobus roseus]|uniref:Abasic site processing protein n=1 Tax=Terriglobus roseus TaxID=392734 RepID=A0A1H4JBX6_9BACT|nr:Putative SOS response-associated peptidase YedK [Terriglobus roseus]